VNHTIHTGPSVTLVHLFPTLPLAPPPTTVLVSSASPSSTALLPATVWFVTPYCLIAYVGQFYTFTTYILPLLFVPDGLWTWVVPFLHHRYLRSLHVLVLRSVPPPYTCTAPFHYYCAPLHTWSCTSYFLLLGLLVHVGSAFSYATAYLLHTYRCPRGLVHMRTTVLVTGPFLRSGSFLSPPLHRSIGSYSWIVSVSIFVVTVSVPAGSTDTTLKLHGAWFAGQVYTAGSGCDCVPFILHPYAVPHYRFRSPHLTSGSLTGLPAPHLYCADGSLYYCIVVQFRIFHLVVTFLCAITPFPLFTVRDSSSACTSLPRSGSRFTHFVLRHHHVFCSWFGSTRCRTLCTPSSTVCSTPGFYLHAFPSTTTAAYHVHHHLYHCTTLVHSFLPAFSAYCISPTFFLHYCSPFTFVLLPRHRCVTGLCLYTMGRLLDRRVTVPFTTLVMVLLLPLQVWFSYHRVRLPATTHVGSGR
jgi:hypothetical protein